MAFISPKMLLQIWNSLTDPYDHEQLAGNFQKVDAHDHTSGKGNQIPTAGLADGAVTLSKIYPGTISTSVIADGGINASKIEDGSITAAKLANALRPSQGATTGAESLRALGAAAGQAVAGDDPRIPSIPGGSALLTGATQNTRYVGGTVSGAPSTGTFAAGDLVVAQDGKLWVCTTSGSPGTWVQIGGAPASSVVVGSLVDYAGGADPTDPNWLLADGRTISRTSYSTLFDAIGITYGTGNGTTTFNIPDLRGRVAVAPDSMGTARGSAAVLTSGGARGNAGGAETVALSGTHVPAHTHSVSIASHDHGGSTQNAGGYGNDGGASLYVNGGGGYRVAEPPYITAHGHGINAGGSYSGATGGLSASSAGTAHTNMQPYVVLNKIIRVA